MTPPFRDRLTGWTWLAREVLLPPQPSDAEPIVVGGCGRSGTTLLQVILDSHPDLSCVRESSILRLGAPPDLGRLAARTKVPLPRLHALLRQSRRHGAFVEAVLAEHCAASGKSRWAEKSPRNVRRLRHVFREFPKARFVHVLRDGRDAVCSLRTHPRWKRIDGQLVELDTWKPVEDCARRWATDVGAGLAWRGHPGYHELRYEDLTSDPEGTLRALLQFLGLPWSPVVLEHHRGVRPSGKDPGFEKPLFRTSIGRWRRDLTPDDARVVLRRCGPLLKTLGYAHDDGWVAEAAGRGRPSRPARGTPAGTAAG